MRDIFVTEYNKTYAQLSRQVRFAVKTYSLELNNGEICEASFIVLIRDGMVEQFTRLEEFAEPLNKKTVKYASSPNRQRITTVCDFLNFALIENYEKYIIDDIQYLTNEVVSDYMKYLSQKRYGKSDHELSVKTVLKERNFLAGFLYELARKGFLKNILPEEIAIAQMVARDGVSRTKLVPVLEVIVASDSKISRRIKDIPDDAVKIILKTAMFVDPEMTLPMMIQAASGLRTGEVLQIRGNNSQFGGNLFFSYDGQWLKNIQIDVRCEHAMRDDGKAVGHVKRKRIQRCLPLFLLDILDAYKRHMELIREKRRNDADPLFLARRPDENGVYQALTDTEYRRRFHKILDLAAKEMARSGKYEIKDWADQASTRSIGPHIFRHYFSVMVVIKNLHSEQLLQILMDWRGDRSPLSCQPYIAQKGQLNEMLHEAKRVSDRYFGMFLDNEVLE